MSAGFLLTVLGFIPGLASPFVVGQEAFVCLTAAFVVFLIVTGPQPTLLRWPWWWSAILLSPVLVLTWSAWMNGSDWVASNGPVRSWCYALFFIAVRLASADGWGIQQLVELAATVGGIEGALVVLQVLFGQHVFQLSSLPSAKWRAFGTLGNPDWVGAYLAATLPIALARVQSARGAGARWRSGVVAGATLAGLTLTLSRGAWVAAAAGLGVFTLLTRTTDRRRSVARLLPAVLLAGAVAWGSFGSKEVSSALLNTASITGRFRMWQVTAAMIGTRPLRGWGTGGFAGTYPSYQRTYVQARDQQEPITNLTDQPHNEYLYLAAEAGLGATVAFLAVLSLGLWHAGRARAAPVAAALVALAVDALGDVPFRHPATTALLCVLLAASLSAASDRLATQTPRRLLLPERLVLLVLAVLAGAQSVRLVFVDSRLAEARRGLATGDAPRTLQAAQRALRFEPSHGELWSLTAYARAAQGDDNGAHMAATQANAILPEPHVSYLMADIDRRQGHADRALERLRALSETLPGLLRPHLLMGELYAEAGQWEPAAAAFRRVMTMPAKFSNAEERQVRERATRNLARIETTDSMRAAAVLGTVDPAVAVPVLIERLKDTDDGARSNAAETLGRIGPLAQAAVPALIATLKDADLDVRLSAASALGQIGPAAVPALRESLQDTDEAVRHYAGLALEEIERATHW